jgi:hypothetical protein
MTTQEMEDMVKQVYFYCETEQIDPKGIYPDGNLNLLEFSAKLIAVWEHRKKANPAPALSGRDGEPS